jgi:hypothetical protein
MFESRTVRLHVCQPDRLKMICVLKSLLHIIPLAEQQSSNVQVIQNLPFRSPFETHQVSAGARDVLITMRYVTKAKSFCDRLDKSNA